MTRKENILHAATLLFSQKGYAETSMTEVAHMTHVAQGTIFYHFSTKESLFLAILEVFEKEVTGKFDRCIDEKAYADGLDMVEGVISFYLKLSCDMAPYFMLLHRHDAYELAHTNPEFHEYLEAIYDCFVDIFEIAVIRGQKEGCIREGSSRKLAMIVFTLVDGLVRLNTYQVYEAGSLYMDLMEGCRRLLRP